MTAKKPENDLKAPEEREASAVEKLRQSETSKDTEVIRLKNELIAEHEAELQQARADFEAKLQQSMADNAISIQRIVGELERLETLTEKLNNDLKTSEEREASLAEKLRQSETSKNTVVTALKHELDLSEQKATNLESSVRAETAATVKLLRDEHQKRLQTLRAEHEAELQQASVDYKKQVQQVSEKRIAEHEAELQQASVDYKKQVQQISKDNATTIKWFEDEYEGRAKKLVAEHEAELQQVRADYEQQLRKVNADNATAIKRFEDELERLKTLTEKPDNGLKAPEGREASALENLRQSVGSKNTADAGLHHDAALMKQKLANLEKRSHTEPLEVPPVSDTGVSLTRPTGDILDITSINMERFSIEPSPDVPLTKNTCLRLIEAMHRVIVGDDDLVEFLFVDLLAEGNVLWTGDPGVAKTTIAKLFARALGCDFNYQQFNPDVLPSDVLGSYVLDQETQERCLRKGGIFANIVMLDELNRASPRTRAGLLTSMEEKSVTIEGTPLALEKPFMVIATQSSLADGTDPLPKAEREQFAVVVLSDRLTSDEALQVRTERDFEDGIAPVTDRESLLRMIEAVRGIYVDKSVEHYIQDVVGGIRRHPDLKLTAGPKTSRSFLAISRALAAVRGRDYVIPDDVKDIAYAVLTHRLVLSEEAEKEGVTTAGIIDGVLANAQAIHYNW